MNNLVKKFGEEKRMYDTLKINYLFDEDIDVCNYVSSRLGNFNIGKINYGRVILTEELFVKSLFELRIFDDDIYSRIKTIIDGVSIYSEYEEIDRFTTVVGFKVNDDGSIFTDLGIVDSYVIPYSIYELSIYHMAHEHIHALKETNYYEYKDGITIGETISIFLELVIYHQNGILSGELIKTRLKSLATNKREYMFYDNLIRFRGIYERDSNGKIKDQEVCMYEFLRSRVGCYLNSFYYAIILYSMYKVNSDKILNLINKVLKHDITTYDMLNYLGLYGDIRGDVFEKELKYIRKRFK